MPNPEAPSLERVIDQHLYHHHIQPIFCIRSQKFYGFECLLRSEHIKNPQQLFQQAILSNKLFDLDTGSVILALDRLNQYAKQFHPDTKFFLNIYPSTLASPAFLILLKETLDASLFSARNVVLEINESEMVHNVDALRRSVRRLQSLGVQIALDDIGKGVLPLEMMLKLHPDIIKLDKTYAHRLAYAPRRQQHLKVLSRYCKEREIDLVLEGIETEQDKEVATACGISYMQGYFLGHPDKISKYA